MNKKPVAALAVLLALTLSGCAGAENAAPEELDYLSVVTVTAERTNKDLIEAAHAACDQILNGRDIFQVHVFEDDTKENGFYEDSVRVALAAAPRLCPDLD